jgi:uncharacterized membrane protein YuzA (DUF378 family)
MATTMDGHTQERRHISERRSHALRASRLNTLDWISMALLIVGGINWGLVGLFGFDLVAALFGEMSLLSRIVYALVGLCALYTIYTSSKLKKSP